MVEELLEQDLELLEDLEERRPPHMDTEHMARPPQQ